MGRGLTPFSQCGTEDCLHDIHAPEDNCARQGSIGDLVEHRVLRHVVIDGDEGGESGEGQSDKQARGLGPRVREGRERHDAGGVDHGQLVGQLHGVFQNGLARRGQLLGGLQTHISG